MARKYSHTDAFYKEQEMKLRDWAKLHDFVKHDKWASKRLNKLLKKGMNRLWEKYRAQGEKNVIKAITDDVKYERGYNTARHIVKLLHEKGITKYDVADIRRMTVKQINNNFKDLIEEEYQKLKADTDMDSYERADWMHSNWYYGGTP